MEQFSKYNWRGSRPQDMNVLKADGFERIINLQSGAQDLMTDSLYETQEKETPSILPVIHIPCSDILPPTEKHVYTAMSLLVEPIKTYMHCHSGVDRTGFVVACYRMIIEKVPFEVAHKEWVDKGRHFWYFWWTRELKKYERNR